MTTPVLAHPLIADLFAPLHSLWININLGTASHNLKYTPRKLIDRPEATLPMQRFGEWLDLAHPYVAVPRSETPTRVFVFSNGRWRKES